MTVHIPVCNTGKLPLSAKPLVYHRIKEDMLFCSRFIQQFNRRIFYINELANYYCYLLKNPHDNVVTDYFSLYNKLYVKY